MPITNDVTNLKMATELSDEARARLTPEQQSKLEELLRAISLQPRNVQAYSSVGRMLDMSGDPRGALGYARKAVALAPKSAVQYDELAHTLRRAALSVDAQRHHKSPPQKQQEKRFPHDEDPCWRFQQPNCFEVQHYTDQQLHIAEDDFVRRTESDSSDTYGLTLLANLYRNRSCDAAVRALRLDPTRPTAYLTLARMLPKGGTPGIYRRALSLLPSHPELHRELGEVLVELRYYGQANEHFRRAIALKPNFIAAYQSLAELRLLREKHAQAFDVAKQALEMLPDAPSVAELIAASLVSGRSARLQALAPYAALPSAEGVATAIALMAQARGEQRRYDEAAALAQAAVGIRPDAARGYAQLARALFEMYGSRGGRSSGRSSSGGVGVGVGVIGSGGGGGGVSGSDSDAAGEASWGLWSGLSRQERLFEATEERKRKKQREKAITACKHAVKLAPKDSATYLRLGRLLRPIPGRLQEAIESYNGCLRYDALNAEAREEQSVLVERMRELQNHRPQPWDVATNLVAGVVTLLALTHFFAR